MTKIKKLRKSREKELSRLLKQVDLATFMAWDKYYTSHYKGNE